MEEEDGEEEEEEDGEEEGERHHLSHRTTEWQQESVMTHGMSR